jgi:predicted O-methyltransferase YrrM
MAGKELVSTKLEIEAVIREKPSWVKNEIQILEAEIIGSEIQARKCTAAIEVGVASGFSSAVIYAALSQNADDPKLFSFDLSRECYFDKERLTGDALREMIGDRNGYVLKTGLTTAEIEDAMVSEQVQFAFIDASHKTPWAALDLLSVSRFLAPKSLIAFHDMDMIFKKSTRRNNNGSRDIFRCWIGNKYRYDGVTNLGFVVYEGDREALLLSIGASLLCDWDEALPDHLVAKFSRLLDSESVSSAAARFVQSAMLSKINSARHFRPLLRVLPKDTMRRLLGQGQFEEVDRNVMAMSRDGAKLKALPTYALYYGAKAQLAGGKLDRASDMLDIVLARSPNHGPAAELRQELAQRRAAS